MRYIPEDPRGFQADPRNKEQQEQEVQEVQEQEVREHKALAAEKVDSQMGDKRSDVVDADLESRAEGEGAQSGIVDADPSITAPGTGRNPIYASYGASRPFDEQHAQSWKTDEEKGASYWRPSYQQAEPFEARGDCVNFQWESEETRIQRIVDERMKKHQPRGRWWRALAFLVVGALIGSACSAFIVRNWLKTAIPVSVQSMPTSSVSVHSEGNNTVENVVATRALPSIVGITTMVKSDQGDTLSRYFGNLQPSYSKFVGSGVIVSQDGYILTNAHVVENGKGEEVRVLLSSDEEKEAKVLWSDATLDLAIIKVDAENLPAIQLGDSDQVKVGDKAIAIGNPLGLSLQSTLTSGYISGMNRSITLRDGNVMDGLFQTDAAINSGNSGGALLNADGQLIGINTAKPESADGIGFAIPINTARPIVEKVIETGGYDPLYIGITGMNVQMALQYGATNLPTETGVLVRQVYDNSPAKKAGLVTDDIIVALGETKIESMNGLKTALLKYKEGDTVDVTYYHGAEKKTVKVTLTAFDASGY